jgi:transcriptional regulator GlxA family with amidase domain
MRTVLIVAFDGVQSLDLTGPLEVFTAANRWCADRGAAPGYAIGTGSLGGHAVRTSSGLRLLPDADLCTAVVPDLLIVPGGVGARRRDQDLVGWLREHARAVRARATEDDTRDVTRLAAVCTGAFLLAEAGLLAGRTVTTHWERCAELAAQYPDIDVDPDPIFIRDGDLATSAGVTAGIDLALALVEDEEPTPRTPR